jgi:hypothetical protein
MKVPVKAYRRWRGWKLEFVRAHKRSPGWRSRLSSYVGISVSLLIVMMVLVHYVNEWMLAL